MGMQSLSKKIAIGRGALGFDYKANQMSDGIYWFKVLSPSLLLRLRNRKPTRNYISGVWLVIGDTIVFFIKKRYVFQSRDIKEDMTVYDIIQNKRRKG